MRFFPAVTRRTDREGADRRRFPAVACRTLGMFLVAMVVPGVVRAVAQAPAAAGAEAKETPLPAPERIAKLSTSDGVALAAWYYPPAQAEKDVGAAPVVILLHDLGGSHESVAPLAQALQTRGIAVVAPDLRGHGASAGPDGRDHAKFRAGDFKNMTVSAGGRIREEADGRGDVETVRNWIQTQAEAGTLDMGRLVVVGCGVGASVAAHWTVLDAGWPDLVSGPQGRQVRGLVLVSPALAARGFTISPALAAEPLRKTLPVLVIAGARDADAVKIYEQLKRQRPDAWSEKRAGQAQATQAPKLRQDALPTLYLRQFDAELSADRLAAFVPQGGRGVHPAASIRDFLELVTTEEP